MTGDRPRPLYWLITGAVLGIGLNSILFLVLVPAGLLLLAYGVTRLPRIGFWLTLVGLSISVLVLTL